VKIATCLGMHRVVGVGYGRPRKARLEIDHFTPIETSRVSHREVHNCRPGSITKLHVKRRSGYSIGVVNIVAPSPDELRVSPTVATFSDTILFPH
jgi:hypothetical protein